MAGGQGAQLVAAGPGASRRTGRIPTMPAAEIQRITRDVLIARTVKREGALLVTENVRDFELIRQFCSVRVKSGREHFGHEPGRK
ncbi:MAG: hypothetical protein IT175_11890 [Acidobacteria bacterium]|nr:hypothetical protein [Acidobacteriota bacterium]